VICAKSNLHDEVLYITIFNIILTLTLLNDKLNNVKVNINLFRNLFIGVDVMGIDIIPEWLANIEDEDVNFIKKFLLASGSLKEIAKIYGVTYPTVRLRLDRLIQKIQIAEDTSNEPYISLIKRLTVSEKLDFDTAKILITAYKNTKKGIN
jgi:hypothetical protein